MAIFNEPRNGQDWIIYGALHSASHSYGELPQIWEEEPQVQDMALGIGEFYKAGKLSNQRNHPLTMPEADTLTLTLTNIHVHLTIGNAPLGCSRQGAAQYKAPKTRKASAKHIAPLRREEGPGEGQAPGYWTFLRLFFFLFVFFLLSCLSQSFKILEH